MTAPGLAELRKRAVPGRCLCCQRKAAARRVVCGRKLCLRLYNSAWHTDNRRAHPERYGRAFYRAKNAVPAKPVPRRRTPIVVLRARAAVLESSAVPWLGNNGESYSEFCRRVERGGCGGR